MAVGHITASLKPTTPRKLVVSRAWSVSCPRCGATIKGVHVGTAALFITCTEKRRRPGAETSERCGGRLYAVGAGHGLCLVLEITDAEHAHLASPPRDPLEVYEYLGVLSRGTWIRESQAHLR